MDNVKGILILLTMVLAATTFVFFFQASTAKAQVAQAELLGETTRSFLSNLDVRCSALPNQFDRLRACIEPLLLEKDFERDTLKQPDRNGNPGYLVIENMARRTYDGELLSFHYNRQLQQQGCNVPGPVGPEVTCRFELPGECQDGDILEVFYPLGDEDIRVFLHTC